MKKTMTRVGMGIVGGAAVLALTAGSYVSAQNQNTGAQPGVQAGRRGGPPDGRGPGAPGGRFGGPGRGPLAPMFLNRLNLTEAQRSQVSAIVDAAQQEQRALVERARAARLALDEAVAGDTLNEGLVRQRAADLGAVEADLAVARAHIHAQVFQILTADQKAQVQQRQQQMKERAADGPPRGRGRAR